MPITRQGSECSNHELTTVLIPLLLVARTILSSLHFLRKVGELAFYESVSPASAGTSLIPSICLSDSMKSLRVLERAFLGSLLSIGRLRR